MSKRFPRISRVSVPRLDAVLGRAWPVGNDGFVRVIDYMGGDQAVVQAARISYGAGTKTVRQDTALIRFLMRHDHTTPFEMCELKLHLRVPMDTWRQWVRHRTASINEYSTRYSVAIDSMATTDINEWRRQSVEKRQGSGGFISAALGKALSRRERDLHVASKKVYLGRLKAGVAREQARKDLPLSTYTECYWKIDLHNLMRFLKLRMDGNAQLEIRNYAAVIGDEILRRWCPATWHAFKEFQINQLVFGETEQRLLKLIVANKRRDADRLARKNGFIIGGSNAVQLSGECREFLKKLELLGVANPW
jgi:thymidylate synthase (FAD)